MSPHKNMIRIPEKIAWFLSKKKTFFIIRNDLPYLAEFSPFALLAFLVKMEFLPKNFNSDTNLNFDKIFVKIFVKLSILYFFKS